MMEQSGPHNSWVISNFHLRKGQKFTKSNRSISEVKFLRHTLTPTTNFGRDRKLPIPTITTTTITITTINDSLHHVPLPPRSCSSVTTRSFTPAKSASRLWRPRLPLRIPTNRWSLWRRRPCLSCRPSPSITARWPTRSPKRSSNKRVSISDL